MSQTGVGPNSSLRCILFNSQLTTKSWGLRAWFYFDIKMAIPPLELKWDAISRCLVRVKELCTNSIQTPISKQCPTLLIKNCNTMTYDIWRSIPSLGTVNICCYILIMHVFWMSDVLNQPFKHVWCRWLINFEKQMHEFRCPFRDLYSGPPLPLYSLYFSFNQLSHR